MAVSSRNGLAACEDAFADGAADRLRNSEADPHPGIESGVTDPDGVPAQPLSLPVGRAGDPGISRPRRAPAWLPSAVRVETASP